MFRFALAVTLFSSLCSAPMLRAEEPVPIEEEPQHHLRFENSHVRFFDVRLPPGYRGVMHIHHHDGVFVNTPGLDLLTIPPPSGIDPPSKRKSK